MQTIILGIGGHGWQSLDNFIANSDTKNQIIAYSLTVDFGGASGFWTRLMELNQSQLCKQIYGKKLDSLPFGDWNKVILFFFGQRYGQTVAESYNIRTLDLESLLTNFEIISDYLAFDQSTIADFSQILATAVNFATQNLDQIKYSQKRKKICLGYPLNEYIYHLVEPEADLNWFYQQKGIFPSNFNLAFAASKRQILTGSDIKKNYYQGEDLLDHSQFPIFPQTMLVLDKSLKPSNFSEGFYKNLESADKIIIPNGSVANWLPFFNEPQTLQILKSKSKDRNLFWMVNLEKNGNEFDLLVYANYFLENEIQPKIILPASFDLKKSNNLNSQDLEILKNKFEFCKEF